MAYGRQKNVSAAPAAAKKKTSEGDDIAKYCHREMQTVLRTDFRKAVLNEMRKERKLCPGVIVDSDEKRKTTTFVTAETAFLKAEYDEGLYHLPPPPWNDRYFYGPLYDVKVFDKGEIVERNRCWMVRYFQDIITDTPQDFTLVRRPINEPCHFVLQICVLNIDKAPGIRRGYINQIRRVIPAILEPYASPPDAVFVDVDGLNEKEYITSDELMYEGDGIKLLIEPGEPILRISQVRAGRF
eukprot:CAMPEP_0198731114 /NCGR_PEP_ID=MMETSP1475-20131203/28176_1 /TAXON_ID= ORGANISM="Unidentified sp., Strain CCMP1999" /NCGR_SAMPLE_ID=MMETSP1475 /ASSEMBLY_ACC=CAM_ASM_001111 /LENGTH=240 /DNA_ID=CAMNT_0044494027 /DNA_START=124 /DNA_END=847 /DNA_ORIENTATION=-